MDQTGTRGLRIMLGIGLVLTLIALVLLSGDSRREEAGMRAAGVVTAISPAPNPQVEVEFTDRGGAVRRFVAGDNSSLVLVQGERVEVLYDPANPQDAVVDSFGGRSLVPYALLAFGLLFAGLALASMIKLRRARQQAAEP